MLTLEEFWDYFDPPPPSLMLKYANRRLTREPLFIILVGKAK